MRTIQNLKVALFEALEREQALIEAFEQEIGDAFQGWDADAALGTFRKNLAIWDENRYIPSIKSIRDDLRESHERALKWRAEQLKRNPTSS